MLPSINGKTLLECYLEDLVEIIDNEIYRESDQIDYKSSLTVLDIPKENKEGLNKARAEFRKDVCAMANAQGGYLIYGIKEDGKGVPHEIPGITIRDNNTDKFENDIRNILQTVSPKPPHYELHFIPCENNYVVVIRIYSDFYAPYVFLENNQDYRIYRRNGNAALVASYSELRSMFTQSLSLENEIYNYRMERVQYFQQQEDTPEQKYSQFLLLHIIPDTFLDSSYNNNLFILQRKNQIYISDLFSGVNCTDGPIPTVDGVRFTSYNFNEESHLYNNGIAEAFVPLHNLIRTPKEFPKGYLASTNVWEKIEFVIAMYRRRMRYIFATKRLFVCVTIVGCKGIISEDSGFFDYRGLIDRNLIICDPVIIEDYYNDEVSDMEIKKLHLNYLLALGIQYQKSVRDLIAEIQL